MSEIALRPYLPADGSRCAAIFRDAIEFSAADDYDDDQRAAWAADMLYVDPAAGRRGVGGALIDALSKLAQARGAKRLTANASDVSKPLFERMKFVAERRSLVQLDDQWLGHTTMTRTFAAQSAPTQH